MNALGNFAVSFCISCTVIGGLYMLCPKGAAEKAVKYIFSLIFLICIISSVPVLKKINADIILSENELQISDEMRETAARLTVEAALRNAGIEFNEITLYTDKSENGSIKITKVRVVSSAPYEKIQEALGGEDTAYSVEIVS